MASAMPRPPMLYSTATDKATFLVLGGPRVWLDVVKMIRPQMDLISKLISESVNFKCMCIMILCQSVNNNKQNLCCFLL